jgi:undecaprenyl-diphosphatase
LWTLLLSFIDVLPIGPSGSLVGFARINGAFHNFTGVNMALYTVTDWLGLVPICVAVGFAALGGVQLIKRRSLLKVDRDILALGVFYIALVAVFFFFEVMVINYRPVLIEGKLEASYPSSTTLLVMCVMPMARMQIKRRINKAPLKTFCDILTVSFTAFMVLGRIVSGVHWITDILGGGLLGAGFSTLYCYVLQNHCENVDMRGYL